MARIGVVPYLNAVPLVARIEGDVDVVADVPSSLGPRLERGEIDVGLLPVAQALSGIGDGFVGHYGITSDGPVRSVLLFLRRPLPEVRHVLLDPASRSSAGLARWIVEAEAGPGVRFERAARPGPDPAALDADAVLVIGDPALACARAWKGDVLDLGTRWKACTGLPFVYARWTARRGLPPETRAQLGALLDAAAARGVVERETIARAWARHRGRDPDDAAAYVRENVGYEIGAREEAGLRRYAEVLRVLDARRAKETPHA